MSLRRLHQGWRMAIVSLVLVALISLDPQVFSQDNGWQFRLVAEHEGGLMRGRLGPDMTALVQDAWGKGELALFRITVEGGRRRVTQTRRGPDDGTIRIVDLLNGKVLATAASEPWVLKGQFFPETAEVLFYQFPAAPDRDRLTTWRYLEGEPTDCVEVDPIRGLLLVDRRTALVFRSGERPIGRLDVEACAIEWGAPMIQAGQMLDRHGQPTNILRSQLLLPDRARFAYFDVTHNLDPKVVIRSVDDIDHELARIEPDPGTLVVAKLFTTENDLGVSVAAWHGRFLPGIMTRELRLFRLSDYKLARRLNIESWDLSDDSTPTSRLGTAVAGHPLQDVVAVATTDDPQNARITLYDLSDGRKLKTLHFPPFEPSKEFPEEVDIDFLQFSADGRYLVAANGEPRIRVWEMDPAAQEGRTVQTRLERENLDAVRQPAEQGDVEAQYNLGVLYGMGRGVPLDDAEAVRWYRLAAEQGHARAQFNLGASYDFGRGVIEDADEAVRWYRLAAEQGEAAAQHNLGFMYATGRGVPQDDAEAVRRYRLAATQGVTGTQYNLGVAYNKGKGVPKDDVLAYMWFYVAAANGHVAAKRWSDSLENYPLTRTEVRRATDLARECMASLQRQTPEGCALHGPHD